STSSVTPRSAARPRSVCRAIVAHGQEISDHTVITPAAMFCSGISAAYPDGVPAASAATRWPQPGGPWGTCVGPSTGTSCVTKLLSGPVLAGEQRRLLAKLTFVGGKNLTFLPRTGTLPLGSGYELSTFPLRLLVQSPSKI